MATAPTPSNPGPHPAPHAPALTLPDNACDAHCHVFGPTSRFPYAPDRPFTPPEAPLADLQRLHALLGIRRAVVVQSAAHGADHTSLLAALEEGAGRYRGVALIRPDTPAREIARLHEAGVRGTRLHFLPHLGQPPTPEATAAITDLVRPYGWHLALHVTGDVLAEHEDFIRSLPLRLVIDHMGRVDLRQGLASRTAPERVVWDTDFPHPNTRGFVPDETARHRLLVDNPTECFDFISPGTRKRQPCSRPT